MRWTADDNLAHRSASVKSKGRARRTIPEFIDQAQSNSPAPPSVEVAPAHWANSALHDLTLASHHSASHHSATHHPTTHHHSATHHHSVTHSASHHSASLKEFAHPAHLPIFGIITVVNERFAGFTLGGRSR